MYQKFNFLHFCKEFTLLPFSLFLPFLSLFFLSHFSPPLSLFLFDRLNFAFSPLFFFCFYFTFRFSPSYSTCSYLLNFVLLFVDQDTKLLIKFTSLVLINLSRSWYWRRCGSDFATRSFLSCDQTMRLPGSLCFALET